MYLLKYIVHLPEAPGLRDTTAAEYKNLDYKAERVAASRRKV